MSDQSFRILKLSWSAISIFWIIVLFFVLADPSLQSGVIDPTPGVSHDIGAIIIFCTALFLLSLLIYKIFIRVKIKPSNSNRMLLLAFISFFGAVATSLFVELVFFNHVITRYLNCTIFLFTGLGLLSWFMFIIEIFEGGLHYPYNSEKQNKAQFYKTWLGIIIFLGFHPTYLGYLVKSIWAGLTTIETILQTFPVLLVGIFIMVGLFVNPWKILKIVENRREKIGMIALFLAGVFFMAFFISYIIFTLSVADVSTPAEVFPRRWPFYYISITMIPLFCVFSYIGFVYPAQKN